MSEPLQPRGLSDSTYERPDARWVCGWAADGHPCRMGPDPRGRCHTTAECSPSRQDDRWYCARPAWRGGPCGDGPKPDGACGIAITPCQPVRSWRAKRGLLAAWTIAGTLGLIAALFTGMGGLRRASPGPLATPHSTSARDCRACHTTSSTDAGWFSTAMLLRTGAQESSRCLECHRFGEHAGSPHSRNPHELALLRSNRAARDGRGPGLMLRAASLAAGGITTPNATLTCATCHQEHRGPDHDLTRVPTGTCQVCHAVQFGDFPNGHPEFGRVQRRHLGVRFDHLDHKEKNFGKQEFTCARCHQLDSGGRAMGLRSFAKSCAGCHQQGSEDHHSERITAASPLLMIQLPVLVWTEEEDGHWAGDVGVADEALPPMLLLLLAGDDEAMPGLQSLAEDADGYPADWEPDDADMQTQFEEAILRLVRELAAGDVAALRVRLANALGAEPGAPEVSALVEQLAWSRFAMRAYQQRWLPQLGNSGTADLSSPEGAGWHESPDDVAVVYRALGHGDPLLSRWIDALSMHVGRGGTGSGAADAYREEVRKQVFEAIASKDFGGYIYSSCLKCHSIEMTNQGPRVNWVAAGRETQATGYAKFDHGVHLTALRSKNPCMGCHELRTAQDTAHLEEVSRAFLPHRKAQCLNCHGPGRGVVQRQCLTCHEYHMQTDEDMLTIEFELRASANLG